jgi:hypothetical protein
LVKASPRASLFPLVETDTSSCEVGYVKYPHVARSETK